MFFASWDLSVAHSIGAIYSHMAMYSNAALDLTFHALADGTRRSMIHVLAKGETRSAGELAASSVRPSRPFPNT